MRRWIVAAAAVIFGGCDAVTENDFIAQYEDLYCKGYAICATDEMLRTINQRECLVYLSLQDYPERGACRYESDAAEACLEALSLAGCAGPDPEMPPICADVYSKCALPIVPLVGEPEPKPPLE